MSPSVHCIDVLQDQEAKEKALADLSSMSSDEILYALLQKDTATDHSLISSAGDVGDAFSLDAMLESTSGGAIQPNNPVVMKPKISNPEGMVR